MSEELKPISPVDLFLNKPSGLFPDSQVSTQSKETTQVVEQTIVQPDVTVVQEVTAQNTQETEVIKQESKVIETPLFKLELNPNQNDNISDWDAFAKIATEKYGQEIKNPQDAISILNKIEEYSKSEKELLEQANKAKGLEETIVSLPEDIKMLIHEHINGGDYKEVLASLSKQLDYTKDASSYEKSDLILMYNSDITSEDIEEMGDKALSKLYEASVKLYNSDREKSLDKVNSIKKSNEQKQKVLDASIVESIAHLKQTYPQMTNVQLEMIANKMRNGYALADSNGYAKDAALKITMAEFGHDIIGQLKNTFEQEYQKKVNQEVSKELETIARHQNDTPPLTQSNPNTSEYSKQVDNTVSFMTKKSLF